MNTKIQNLLRIVCTIALSNGAASGTEATLLDDTTTFTGSVAATYGDGGNITVSSTTNKVGLLKFGISDILPVDITAADIATATLRIFVNTASTGTGSVTIHKNTTSWTEGAQAGDWPTSNSAATVVNEAPVSEFGLNQFCTFDVTPIVKDWVVTPESNHGFAMRANGTIEVKFSAKENTTKSHQAVLDITLIPKTANMTSLTIGGKTPITWDSAGTNVLLNGGHLPPLNLSYTFAIGYNSWVEGNHGFAAGLECAAGQSSVAFGDHAAAHGWGSAVFGHDNGVYDNFGLAAGEFNRVRAQWASTVGLGLIATTPASLVIGRFNLELNNPANPQTPLGEKYLFVVGNGTSDASRSDAFSISETGRIKIQRQGDISMGQFTH
jgi:hypothetical protein